MTLVPALTKMISGMTVMLESKVPSVRMVTVPVDGESESGWGSTLVEMVPPELLMVTYTSADWPLKVTELVLFMKRAFTLLVTVPPPAGISWVR